MNIVHSLVEVGPVPANANWRTVITADLLGGTALGSVGGVTTASLVVEPLLYPGEMQAVDKAESQLQNAKSQQVYDEQTLAHIENTVGKHDPLTDQARSRVASDRQTVTTAQHRLDALPNHDTAVMLDGLGIGVAAGLLVAGVKLGVRKIRTDRAARA